MKYSKAQKIISYILLFLFFFNISVNIPPIFSLVLARESSFYNLVSIIVDEKSYAEIKKELERYSKDISGVLENTKVVILPVPEDASYFQIASMNEAMFFDGYKSLSPVDFESKLISTVFVGNIPLPVVYKGEEFTKTVLPYVDFKDKSYIFNREKNRYEENLSNPDVKPEIEFSFISPNTGSFDGNIKALKDYFDKNHDFYTGNGLYENLNGKKDDIIGNKPYVFYYDYFREASGLNPNLYSGYLATREKNEDLIYNRYTKKLLSFLVDSLKVDPPIELTTLSKTIKDEIGKIDSGDHYKHIYDIQTKKPIESLKKNFIDSFSKGVLGDLRKNVFNAGRYNFGQNVNVDFIPHIISEIDIIADQILKSANDLEEISAFESFQEKKVRKVAVPTLYKYFDPNTGEIKEYKNFLFGKDASSIKTTLECSFYRGSEQHVEANRGLNILNVEKDINTLSSIGCAGGASGGGLDGLWGKNTPLYLDSSASPELKLKPGYDPNGAIVDLFDIVGSKLSGNGSWSSKGRVEHCIKNNNYILSKHIGFPNGFKDNEKPRTLYELRGEGWNCYSDNNSSDKTFNFENNFIEDQIMDFGDSRNPTKCDIKIYLDGKLVRELKNPNYITKKVIGSDGNEKELENCKADFYYKGVSTAIRKSEPTVDTIAQQEKYLISPNLPIDGDRYMDFISKEGKNEKIFFYNYFKPEGIGEKELQNLDLIRKVIEEKELKKGFGPIVSFNALNSSDPAASMLLNPGIEKIKGLEPKKSELLPFAILWNKLSTSRKYSIVYEKYLSNDFDDIKKNKPKYSQLSNIFKKSVLDEEPKSENLNSLPRLKKEYEIAYLGANGDAQNMMIRFDPDLRKENPYANIISKNYDLSSKIFGNKIISGNIDGQTNLDSSGGLFKCSPPDGVPITKWFSAIECRLKDMLPPKIEISDGHCSVKSILDYKHIDEKNFGDKLVSISESGNVCSVDSDKNGISDCLEKVDTLKFSSDSTSYSYNSNVNLVASFYEKDKKATFVNNTPVTFEIVKIEKAKNDEKEINSGNIEVVYDINSSKLNNKEIIKEYINFSSIYGIRSSLGEVKYGFSTKNKDLNVYVRASSKTLGNSEREAKTLVSDILKIEIRSDILLTLSTKYTKSKKSFSNSLSTIESSNKSNIYIVELGNKTFDDIKTDIEKFSESEENLILGLVKSSKKNKNSSIKFPIKIKLYQKNNVIQELDIKNRQDIIKLSPLSNSGNYILEISDSEGFSTKRQVQVTSSNLEKIDLKLGSNLILSGGSISTNLFTIYDRFNNPSSGKRYDAELSFNNDNFSFIDSSDGEKKSVKFSIYEGFKAFRIKSGEKPGEANLSIKIIDPETNKVILVKEQKIKSVAFTDIKISNNSFSVGGEKSKFKLSIVDEKGNLIPGINSRVYIGGGNNYFSSTKNYFEIKNSEAEIEIETNKNSGKDISTEFQIEGINKIFNKKINILPSVPLKVDVIVGNSKIEADTDKYTTVYLELKDKYDNVVFNDSTTKAKVIVENGYDKIISGGETVQFKNGVASLKVYATKNPGTGYFKVVTEPSLEENFFEIKDEKNTIKVNGVSENVGKVETFYFWNKEKIQKQNYNSLYSVLLGGNYGDLEQKDYLAGSLIFEKDSRALAVTTLLDDGSRKNNVLSLNKYGNIKNIFSKKDLSQNLDTKVSLESGKLNFNIFNKSLNINIGQIFYNLKNVKLGICNQGDLNCFDEKETSIFGKKLNQEYNFYLKGKDLIFVDNIGNEIFSVDSLGNIEKKSELDFEINKNNSGKNLSLNIFVKNQLVGELLINLRDIEVNLSRDENIFKNKKNIDNNSVLLILNSNFYGFYKNGENSVIFYNDPLDSKNSLNNFTNNSTSGFENFKNKEGIGWKDENKTLLSFAAGKNVGASVKDFMSFYTINIGDPFIKLKNQRKKFNGSGDLKQFDSTIGEIIVNDENVVDYKVFDYNGDGKKDILLRKRDNYFELLENKKIEKKFLNQGNLVQIYDLGQFFEVGDFTGDKFDDIFFVGKDGKPYLLNNVSKDFTRFDLTNKLGIKSNVSQVSVFDMDNDGKKDLIILDELGELNIFYGGGSSANPTFTKKKIAEGLGISLSSDKKTFGGAIYYDGLKQPLGKYVESGDEEINSAIVDSEIYINIPFDKNGTQSIDDLGDNTIEQTSFLKSEYFSSVGLSYEKVFKDKNGGLLASGDKVDVEIKLTNNSGKYISNIKFLEKIEKYFIVDKNTISNSKSLSLNSAFSTYDFSFEKFDLKPNETLTIKYSGKLKTLTHLKIKTGLFEKGEVGDDKFGDILLDDLNLNCGAPISIFKSTGARDYQKGFSEEKCDISKLPDDISKLSKDENRNGIPDYIDSLSTSDNELERQKFSREQIDLLNKDSDNDGISDDKDFYNNLAGISNLEKGLDTAQNLLDGLSCGFNNGGCISTPLNWAPLAPGNDPTFMGKPIGDGLKVGEGMPIFSALTGKRYGKDCLPSVWPISPTSMENCLTPGAGGSLGINSKSNFFRMFVTPTLTGGVGTAICFGGPASIYGNSVPKGFAPLFPGGNCIIIAKPIIGCSNDGSDGDPSSIGQPDNFSDFSIINAGSGSSLGNNKCNTSQNTKLNQTYVKDYLSSSGIKDNKNLGIGVFKEAMENHQTYDGRALFNMNFGGTDSISVGIFSSEDNDFSDIEKIEEERITSFPEFLMDWIVRQIDEIISKLTDFPTLFIIFPDFSGIYDSNKSWEENWKNYSEKNKKSDYKILGSENNFINKKGSQVNSGIREAYEFISTLPLVNLKSETINITVPWISKLEIDRTLESWKSTLDQRKKEASKYSNSKNYEDKALLEINGLIGSIEKNIEILESYRDIPEKIKELIGKKEDYLYQILCNVEIISDVVGGWIGKNGERFKAWVQLYILIKAILKSWQTFIDIFVDYEQACKQCKNERHDLLDYQFKLISMIVPKIPVVRFPKWPDIILDLHNIRASIDISIPEFEIDTKPINIPNLPNLILPDVPNINGSLNLPDIPLLPKFEIPELPDIPTLPKVELPELPPPPKLPKLFAGFEFIIDISKLVTKAMCVLKSSPFHPEWRAGDQIAFLTERNGFLSLDFITKSLPEFSMPFIDAIEVKTFVNLEFETDFITELSEQLVKPINSFTSDFTNLLNISIGDLDFSNTLPTDINIDVNLKTSMDETFHSKLALSKTITNQILKGVEYSEKNKEQTFTNEEFKNHISKVLTNPKISGNPIFDDLRDTWKKVDSYTFKEEDKVIKSLKDYNFEKFETLKNIIETERQKNKNFEKDLENIFSGKVKVSETKNSSIEKYNQSMEKFNKKTFENIGKAMNFDEKKSEVGEIKELGKDLKNKTQNVFGSYSKEFRTEGTLLESYKKASNLLSVNNKIGIGVNQTGGSCSNINSKSNYSYNYSGIYTLENGKSYRLFDYIDEVDGKEKTTSIDFDNDGDEDLLYFINNILYLKENFSKKDTKVYLNEKPIILESSDNKFLKNNFIESVNNARESTISNSMINLTFSSIPKVYNYRLSYFDIVDKHLNLNRNEIDTMKNKFIVDGISGIDYINLIKEEELFIKRKDLVSISSIGNFKGFEMETKKLKNIKDDLNSGKTVTISSGTRLYSGFNILDIIYKFYGDDKENKLRLEPNTNIELKQDIIIVGISRGNGYIETSEEVKYNGDEISKMKGLPIIPGTKIYFSLDKNQLQNNSYIDLEYYDNTEYRVDFNKVYSWELYDLGNVSAEYLFTLDKNNNYYYSKISPFKNNIIGTSTNQILLSPQLKADKSFPEISLNSVKVPVYQDKEIDITDKILEDSGINGVSKIYIDFFLDADTDGDGNYKNDDNTLPNLRIFKKDNKIFLKIGKFSVLQKKKIGINVFDENGNYGFKEVDFEVYSPIPEIETYDGVTISGKISENLKDEPISFYRFRAGNLSKLGGEDEGKIVYTNEKGEFSLKTGSFKSGLSIKDKKGKEIASISEKTGKISLNSVSKSNYDIFVKLKESLNYPEISILEKTGKTIFNQVLIVKGNPKVSVVSDFKEIEKNGIYVIDNKKSDLDYYILPDNISNNPGVFVGYNKNDKEKTPILTIYPDGRIEKQKNLELNYSNFEDYIVIKISDNGKNLFEVLYKIDADYFIN